MPFGELSRQMVEERFAKWWKLCWKGVPRIRGKKFNVSPFHSKAKKFALLPAGQGCQVAKELLRN